MHPSALLPTLVAALPMVAMLVVALLARRSSARPDALWRCLHLLSGTAFVATVASLATQAWLAWQGNVPAGVALPGLQVSLVGAVVAVLVQAIGVVLGHFSMRYLQGEPRQARYVAGLATVLGSVQLLLLADHWIVLIAAWAAVGVALERLLCFYPDRPFALLAAHKKQMADRLADGLLLAAATLAWATVGSGSFTDLFGHLQANGTSPALRGSALLLALAVILRVALLPVHGWLIQVMEAPTPVSALLHAGVVNLGGYVLIRLWPLLEPATPARWLLVAMGVATAALAGLVMLTRVSIKVRLAWSTVAQMGFMMVECSAGLTTLALLHLIGHSLYKSHAFLSSSDTVRQARLHALHDRARPTVASVLLAPLACVAIVVAIASIGGVAAWPWWWSVLMGLAWAPLLWQPVSTGRPEPAQTVVRAGCGVLLAAAFTAIARLAHALPLGLADAPMAPLGVVVLAGMSALYAVQATLLLRPGALERLRRWSYAGFYVDELFTRAALRLWPGRWVPPTRRAPFDRGVAALAPHTPS